MPRAFWKVLVTRSGLTPSILLRSQIQSAARSAASSHGRFGSSSGTQAAVRRCVVGCSSTTIGPTLLLLVVETTGLELVTRHGQFRRAPRRHVRA
jgi:hypothetical protein